MRARNRKQFTAWWQQEGVCSRDRMLRCMIADRRTMTELRGEASRWLLSEALLVSGVKLPLQFLDHPMIAFVDTFPYLFPLDLLKTLSELLLVGLR
jgi:hypothetical protein